MSDNMKAFGAYVRGCRAILDWSQSYLGERVGLSQRAIHRIEAGTVDVRHSNAQAIESTFARAGVTAVPIARKDFQIIVKSKAWLPRKKTRR